MVTHFEPHDAPEPDDEPGHGLFAPNEARQALLLDLKGQQARGAGKVETAKAKGDQSDTSKGHSDYKTWEQKYESVDKYIRENYYPKERLEQSNFYQLEKRFTGHIKTEKDYIEAIKAETKALNDPWTEFTTDAERKQMRQNSQQGLRSAGIWVERKNGKVVVDNILYGFPAYESDLRIGDKIVSVNGADVKNMEPAQIQALLSGKSGQQIKLGFETPEGKAMAIDLPIADPKDMTSSARLIDDPASGKKVLHLQLLAFNREAIDQLEESIKAIPSADLKSASGLILDLRGNEGGLLKPISRVGDMFVSSGDFFRVDSRQGSDVVQTLTIDEKDYTLDSDTRKLLHDLPLVTMVNGTTRSAPETLTASLRARGRLTAVVGENTYGKGIAFDDVDIPDGTLRLTIEELKTPAGVAWHGKGIKPDIELSNPRGSKNDAQLARALQEVTATSH